MNPQDYLETFAKKMAEKNIKPELECFEPGMIANGLRLAKKGLIKEPLHFDFVLGVPGAMPGEPKDLLHMVNSIPSNATWTVAGIGRYELPLAVMAIVMGGHVRVGFEDNIFYSKGVLAESNAQLVERIARISRDVGREVATPEEARKILGLYK
jgi:3-keto-5-aminohexanoate cleavage enzyme